MCKLKRVVYRVEVFYEQGGVARSMEFTITKGKNRCFAKYEAPNAIVKAGSQWKFAGQYFVRSIVHNFLTLDQTLHQCQEVHSPPAKDDFCSPATEAEPGVEPEANAKEDATEPVQNHPERSDTSTPRQNDMDRQSQSPVTSERTRVAESASTAHQGLSLQDRLTHEFYEQKLKYLKEEHEMKMKILKLQLEMLLQRKMQLNKKILS
ncbi:uncharacterized protein LOC125721087 [Brienomyrus brachyistius]|uniref:uncharacterized protein LOC125721087 n=1 Tax=Brienomyrus brachyistius TaxID=42636 RepID=UPI0020B1F2A1|nr:uncharacterized protein LOC125721087 [Brienomyrus brachyistius]